MAITAVIPTRGRDRGPKGQTSHVHACVRPETSRLGQSGAVKVFATADSGIRLCESTCATWSHRDGCVEGRAKERRERFGACGERDGRNGDSKPISLCH